MGSCGLLRVQVASVWSLVSSSEFSWVLVFWCVLVGSVGY